MTTLHALQACLILLQSMSDHMSIFVCCIPMCKHHVCPSYITYHPTKINFSYYLSQDIRKFLQTTVNTPPKILLNEDTKVSKDLPALSTNINKNQIPTKFPKTRKYIPEGVNTSLIKFLKIILQEILLCGSQPTRTE